MYKFHKQTSVDIEVDLIRVGLYHEEDENENDKEVHFETPTGTDRITRELEDFELTNCADANGEDDV